MQQGEPPMSELPAAMTPQIANIHKATIDGIAFSKKQQWLITNYTVLIYAAVFGLAKSLGTISTGERCGLTLLAVMTLACAIALLMQIQRDLRDYRVRLEKIHDHWLTEEEKNVMDIKPYVNPMLRGGWFLAALIGVTAIGAGIVIYSLWR